MNLKSMGRTIVAFAAFATLAAGASAETYAVLFGINDYPDVLDAAGNLAKDQNGSTIDPDLRGCVNDVNGVEALLRDKFGVPAANIRKALNGDANAKNFIDNLSWVVSTAQPGDQVFFYYSGHGGQIEAEDEEDGIDEVIVLADNKLVSDNFFAEMSAALSLRGVNATYVFDSCYSGGMSRDPKGKSKYLDLRKSKAHSRISGDELKQAKFGTKGDPTEAPTPGEFAFLFAGQEDQPTIDLSGVPNIPDHGLFTLFLLDALNGNPNLGISELIDAIAGTVKDDLEFDQLPRMEASSADRTQKPLIIR